VIAYASRTGTRRNLEALRRAGWRLLVSATGPWRTEGFSYAIDNGAWTAFQNKTMFDEGLFTGIVDKLGSGSDWIVVPDIVAGGIASLEFSLKWIGRLRGVSKLLIAVQDGMTPEDVEPHLADDIGIFIGGGNTFKEDAIRWGDLAQRRGAYLHMGRVNTQRRIKIAEIAGCDSFDGTSASRYVKTLGMLDAYRRQQGIDF
jgi:hypothetical protein